MKLSWNWLKDYITVKDDPEAVGDRLTMTGLEVKRVEKIGKDYLLETEVTSNRPDLLSHVGVARELSAIYNQKLKFPENKIQFSRNISRSIQVKTLALKSCPYYSAMVLEQIECGKTPEWMSERLSLCGIRPINFLVDVTNYVLLETGQPLHAFDLDRLKGKQISARQAKAGENLAAIDNNCYDLTPDDIVISDDAGPVALGGVMGGKNSEVSQNTKNILIESALFSPVHVRKTSRRLKLASESSYRFERAIDPQMIDFSRNRAAALIAEHAKIGRIGLPEHAGTTAPSSRSVSLHINSIERILGVSVPKQKAKTILTRLGFDAKGNGLKLVCKVPSFRPDVSIEEDLIEEIARIDGYDRIPETIPSFQPTKPVPESIIEFQQKARDICVGMGLSEVVTFGLINQTKAESLNQFKEQWVTITNPRNSSLTLMRPSLSLSLRDVIRQNLNMGVKTIPIFEVGKRYLDLGEKLPKEETMCAVALCGEKPSSWLDEKRTYTFYDLKGIVSRLIKELRGVEQVELKNAFYGMLEPGQSFDFFLGETWLAMGGQISKSLCAESDIEKPTYYVALSLTNLFQIKKKIITYQEILKFPSVERDLALHVDEQVTVRDLESCISSLGQGLIRKIELFDLYRGGKLPKGKKSAAFHIDYQSGERTLETEEVNKLHFSIVDELNKRFKAILPPKS